MATRKSPKETPLAAAPARWFPPRPRPAGRVENSPWRLRHRRDNSRRSQAASALQKGKPRRLGFAIAGGVQCRFAEARPPDRIRRPGRPGPGNFGLAVRKVGVPSVGDDCRVSPRRMSDFLCGDEKVTKEAPLPTAPAPRCCPRSARVRRLASKLARAGFRDIDAQFPPVAACASALQKGKASPARLRHCRRVIGAFAAGTAAVGHVSSPRRRQESRV